MQFLYADKHSQTVRVILAEGEKLADLNGPVEILLACDPEEPRFAALLIRAREMVATFGGEQP